MYLLGDSNVVMAQSSLPESFDLNIEQRRVVGDVKTIKVRQGNTVVVRWRSDVKVELHLHGYDVETKVTPGSTAEMRFEAYATGRYPVTVHGFGEGPRDHGHHDTLLHIEIHPN